MKTINIPPTNGKNKKIAIILPYFNEHIGLELLDETLKELLKAGVAKKNIKIFRVPGALEIPFTAKKILKEQKFDAIIALGVVIRSETYHFELVCSETFHGLMQISLSALTPIIFGILTVENEKQARNRIKKGKDFARSALFMTL